MDPSLYYLNRIALCNFLTVLYLLVFAVWGLSLNPRARTNQRFFFMCLHALVWQLGIGFMLCSRDPGLAERWYRFSYLGVVFVGPGVLLFTSSIPQPGSKNRLGILVAYLLTFFFGLEGVLGRSVITGVWEYSWGFYPRYGSLSFVFLALFTLIMGVVFRNLIRGLRRAPSGFEKKQIKALIVAFSIAFLSTLDFVPCFGIGAYPVGFLPIAIFVTLMFGSVYRYQLLDPTPESLARKVLATIADSIIVLDAEGYIRMVNPKAEDLLGYTRDQMLQRHFSSFVDPRSVDASQSLVRNLGPWPKDVESGVITLRHRDGKPIPTSANLSSIPGWKGRILGVVLACRDLQEIVRSQQIIREQEEVLRETQERYSALFNRSLFCVFVHDFEGNFLDANQAALDLLGYSREEISSINFASLLSEDQLPDAVERAREMRQTGYRRKGLATYKLITKSGKPVWVETEASLIYRGGRPYAVQGIARDVTERKRAEEQLHRHHAQLKELVAERTAELQRANEKLHGEIAERIQFEDRLRGLNEELDRRVMERTEDLEKANEELKELDRMKDSFLSSVSHEFRTPLTSIRSFSEILLRYEQEDPETRKEFLRIINSESERLTRLVNDVLDISRIEAGGMVWHDAVLSLEGVIRDIVPAQQKLLQTKSLRLTLDLSPELPPVRADRDRILQVITNLLGNAVKFSHRDGEIRIKAEAFPGRRSQDASTWVKVSISDEGIGIDAKDFGVIFEKFRQVSDDTLKDKPEGTGLGLPICKDIVAHYGGRIWVESRKGEGSSFHFTLPAHTVDAGVRCGDLPGSEQPLPLQNGKTILVVDDDFGVRNGLRMQLEEMGYPVYLAENADEAVEILRTTVPDLVILDVVMPQKGGPEVLAWIRNNVDTCDLPVIMLSGFPLLGELDGLRSLGIEAYVEKSDDLSALFSKIDSILEARTP